MEYLLKVEGLKKYFPVTKGLIFSRVMGWVKAVDGIDFSISEGTTFGLVGESGCGKSTTAKMILLLERPTGGSIIYRGQDVASLNRSELKRFRLAIQAVFQDPYGSLDPRKKVEFLVGEPMLAHNTIPRNEIRERVRELLEQVGIPARMDELYPHEFSGGQRQRIALARALALNPELIVLDEPVSALDVSVRAQIMNLLKELQEKLGLAYLLIAHNLATVKYMSHNMQVMYLGKVVESGVSEDLCSNPLHPYTQALLSAVLPSHPALMRDEIMLPGEVPSALMVPSGCRFHTRCLHAMPICSEVAPENISDSNGHQVSCHLYSLGNGLKISKKVS